MDVAFELLRECIRQPRESAVVHAQCEVRALDIARADVFRVGVAFYDLRRDADAILCVREKQGGVQLSLWGDADTAPQAFIEKAVRQRRDSLVDDAFKLKMDVDHFNEFRGLESPIQLVLDLTDDVEEREALRAAKDEDEDGKESA